MENYSSKLLKTIKFSCSCLFLLTSLPSFSQISEPKILNDLRTFEVTACLPSEKNIVAAWMEKRPERIDNSVDAANMRVAYKSSSDKGENWTEKGIIDRPSTFGTGNPYITNNKKGATYLVCMHIGQDFYSGNISLYQFDFIKKQFILKSVPFKSDNRLLDKPAIACIGNEIHLVYNSYGQKIKNSIKYQYSKDNGLNWSEPIDVFTNGSGGYLGPSITIVDNNQIAVAVGSYGAGKDLYFIKKKTDKNEFEAPIAVAKISSTMGAAMSEIHTDGKQVILSWQFPHQRSETWMAVSKDNGITWDNPLLITQKGNLLSPVFDKKGAIHYIYSDFNNENFFVGYKQLDTKNKIIKEGYLKQPTPLSSFDEYLGAFQKLLIKNNELFAFWIDYPNENKLNFTRWKIK